MLNSSKPLSSSAIKYLLVLSELCVSGQGARCKDIAARMSVSKPSAHSMIQNLCDLGLAEKQKYGAVHLTEQGSEEAARYSLGCAQLSEKLKSALGLSEDVCSHIACTVLAELPEQLAVLSE